LKPNILQVKTNNKPKKTNAEKVQIG